MKKLLLSLLLCTTAAFAQIDISPLPDFAMCDTDNDGVAILDLTANTPVVLGALSPADYTVDYFETQELAQNNEFPIENPMAYSTLSHTVYLRVTENANAQNFAVTTLNLIVLPTPVAPALPILYPSTSNCNSSIYDLTLNNNLFDPLYEVTFYASESDADAGINPISNPDSYVTSQTIVWVRIANVPSDVNAPVCYTITQQQLNPNNDLIVNVLINGQTATIDIISGVGSFTYSIVSGPSGFPNPFPYQTSNVITDMPLGVYTIEVQDGCGRVSQITLVITDTDAPTGETSQTFTEGQTLADLEVTGENIQWYDAPTEGNVLPITTLLVDGTTYYAERSLGRSLRAIRLAVTVHLVLGTNNNSLQSLSYYPNPVKNVLTISNASPINNVAVFNTLGQQVLNKVINTTATSLNLTTLNAGIYFVKVQAGNGSKTIRIVKE